MGWRRGSICKHLSCIEYQRFLGVFMLSNQHLNLLLPQPECSLPPKTPLHCALPRAWGQWVLQEQHNCVHGKQEGLITLEMLYIRERAGKC